MHKAASNVKREVKKVLEDNYIKFGDTDDHVIINCNVLLVSQITDGISEVTFC